MTELQPQSKLSEQDFEDKLNQIVKIIKFKEEICLQVIQHLQSVAANLNQISSLVFLHDQMSKHKIFLEKMSKKNSQSKNKEKSVHLFYTQSFELNQSQRTLVRRVSARILQIFQSYNEKVDKYAYFQKEITLHYKMVKPKFLKLISQVEKSGSTMVNILQLCNLFFGYLEGKFNDQCKKVNKIIELIQNGQIHQLQLAFTCNHCKQWESKSSTKPQTRSSKSIPSSKNLQIIKQNQENQDLRYFSKEKEKITQKLKAMRLQAKHKELIKKHKTKFATKYYNLYHSAMDLHKGHFIEELTSIDEKQHKQKMLAEIEIRNKLNSIFIREYVQCCQSKNLQEKTDFKHEQLPYTQTGLQQQEKINYPQNQEAQNNLMNDEMVDKYLGKVMVKQTQQMTKIKELREIQQSYSITIDNQQRADVKSFRITNPNKKSMIPTPKSNPNLFCIKEMGPIAQSYNFVKLNMKDAHNQRARLPEISNRMFSVDQKHKSTKIIQKPQNYLPSNNNLLLIKTSLNKVKESRKQERSNKIQQNNTNKIENVINKNSQKVEKKTVEYPINSINRNRKIKRSKSGSKIVLQNNDNGSLKGLEINYSTSNSKKIKIICEILPAKNTET